MVSDGKRISFLTTEGEGSDTEHTILLIHGSGVSARSWAEQFRGLRRAFRVVAIDMPGHGESDPVQEATVGGYADAASGLLTAMRTGPVFVAGHSLGGAVAIALAGRHPEMVKGLLLLSTCARLPERDGSLESLLWWLPGPVRKIVFFSLAKRILFAPDVPSRAVRLGMEELRSCRPETILKDMTAARDMDLEEIARGLRVPTLILCGSRDRLTPPTLSERLNELIAGSRLLILEGVGHMLPLEAPARVNRQILEFVESLGRFRVRRPLLTGTGTVRSPGRRLLDKVKRLWKRSAISRPPA